MSAEVVRWIGGPGSGKTYQLLQDVRQEVEDGRTLDDLCLMSFSRAQATDLAARLRTAVFQDADMKTITDRTSTIDAGALRAVREAGIIEFSRDSIIQPGAKESPLYREFMEAHGIPYQPNVQLIDDTDPVARANLPPGNQIIEINAYLRSTMQPPSAWQEAAMALGLHQFNGRVWGIADILPAWQEFKALKGVFEHTDYVQLALDERVEPRGPVLFVDEYQDVSPLQAALIREWINQSERVYVAGDPDQAIYGFRGCSPDLFLSLDAKDRGAAAGQRPVSHRCPEQVMAEAERFLGHAANVSPAPRPGRYIRANYSRNVDGLAALIEDAIRAYPGNGARVFVLSRFRQHVTKIAKHLAAVGIPSTGIRQTTGGPWGPVRIGRYKATLERKTVNVWSLVCAVRRVMTGVYTDRIPFEEAEAFVMATVPADRREHALTDLKAKVRQGTALRVGDVMWWVNVSQDRIFDALNLRPAIIEQIKACLSRERRSGTVINPQMVRVDTIHASKGLEAPAVFLHSGYLGGLLDSLTDPARLAEERRIFFVGATRASRALICFDYLTPVWPLFGRAV